MSLRMFDHKSVAFIQTNDVDQSVLRSIHFELFSYKQTVRTIQYHITLSVVLSNLYESVGTFCKVRFRVPGTH